MTDVWIGPATLGIDGREHAVEVRLSGRFELVKGRYRWAGRVAADASVTAGFRAGARRATVRVPGGTERPARLGEPDPWGRVRLTGTGPPPWPPGAAVASAHA